MVVKVQKGYACMEAPITEKQYNQIKDVDLDETKNVGSTKFVQMMILG